MLYQFDVTVREVMEWLDLSQYEIARRLEINRSTVLRTLNNKTDNVPTQKAIARLLADVAKERGLDISESDLLKPTEENKNGGTTAQDHLSRKVRRTRAKPDPHRAQADR
jgi:transcriptional regulator with XRE-family HTH domain